MKEMKQVITMTNQKIIDFQKEKQKKEKVEIESNNLYEINKNLISQSSPLIFNFIPKYAKLKPSA